MIQSPYCASICHSWLAYNTKLFLSSYWFNGKLLTHPHHAPSGSATLNDEHSITIVHDVTPWPAFQTVSISYNFARSPCKVIMIVTIIDGFLPDSELSTLISPIFQVGYPPGVPVSIPYFVWHPDCKGVFLFFWFQKTVWPPARVRCLGDYWCKRAWPVFGSLVSPSKETMDLMSYSKHCLSGRSQDRKPYRRPLIFSNSIQWSICGRSLSPSFCLQNYIESNHPSLGINRTAILLRVFSFTSRLRALIVNYADAGVLPLLAMLCLPPASNDIRGVLSSSENMRVQLRVDTRSYLLGFCVEKDVEGAYKTLRPNSMYDTTRQPLKSLFSQRPPISSKGITIRMYQHVARLRGWPPAKLTQPVRINC